MFSYTRVKAKLGFGKTSFMNTPDSVQYDSELKTWHHSTNALLWFYQIDVVWLLLILNRHLTPYNWLTSGHIQITRDVDLMLGYYWSSVCDAGTALHKHRFPKFHVKTLLQHEANIGSTSRPGVLGIRPALCPDICVRCRHCSFVNLIT